jgi:N-acetyl-S-(2-succino)cysteine monooxygenase
VRDSLKAMPGLTYCVAESRAQAEDELEELQDLIDPSMGLALLSQRMNFDFSGCAPDDAVAKLPETADGGSRAQLMNELIARQSGLTLRDLYKHFFGARAHGLVIGTPLTLRILWKSGSRVKPVMALI